MNFPIASDLNFKKHCIETHGSIENLIAKAGNGEIVAQADLGMAYSEGFGDELPKDTDKAIGCLNTAVERGYEFPSILEKLGELLDLKGTPQYRRKAYEMYHRAAKLGCTTSQLNLAEMYRCGVEGVVNEDVKEAFKWYKKAAGEDASDVYSHLGVLGGLYAGTMKTMENAVCGTKHRALMFLYKYYLEGDCPEGCPQPIKAVYYLTRAAELGNTEAQLNLGQIYLTGSYEQIKDVAKARRWLGKASVSGDARAKQLLQQCENEHECTGSKLNASEEAAEEAAEESAKQSFDILGEKIRQRYHDETSLPLHPFAISQPVAFSEEMLSRFDWSPTARIYLTAFKLVKEGFEILCKSNFTDARGISLIAQGYLTENSILQAFPVKHSLLTKIFQLCEKNLKINPHFFEGLLLSFALHHFERKMCEEGSKVDSKKVMCMLNIIHLIQKAEPDSVPSENPFKFDENYSSWLHVLYWQLAALFVVWEANEKAAESFENSLKCCPSYFPSKRGLGYALMLLYIEKSYPDSKDSNQGVATEQTPYKAERASDREISEYASWTAEQLRDTSVKVLKKYLEEAPPCDKTYPNVYYYLAQWSLFDEKMNEFKKYYELGQDAEERRLAFLEPVDLEMKDWLSTIYQLLPYKREPSTRCGNRACIKKVKKSELKSCAGCGIQKYCSKDCQRADWKNHKVICNAFKGDKAKGAT